MSREYFKLSEFKCRCDRKECDAVPIEPELVADLNKLRHVIGMPFTVTSGSRCLYWNEKSNGSENSYHLTGKAVDFIIRGGIFVYLIAKLAPSFGFNGIGIGKGFVHLDRRDSASPILYGY